MKSETKRRIIKAETKNRHDKCVIKKMITTLRILLGVLNFSCLIAAFYFAFFKQQLELCLFFSFSIFVICDADTTLREKLKTEKLPKGREMKAATKKIIKKAALAAPLVICLIAAIYHIFYSGDLPLGIFLWMTSLMLAVLYDESGKEFDSKELTKEMSGKG